MKPSEMSAQLRRIAAMIDNSSNPSKDLVIKDLSSIIRRASNDPKKKAEEIWKKIDADCRMEEVMSGGANDVWPLLQKDMKAADAKLKKEGDEAKIGEYGTVDRATLDELKKIYRMK